MSDKHGPQVPVRQDREHQVSLLYLCMHSMYAFKFLSRTFMKEQLGTPEQEISAALTVHIASGARTSHSPEVIILMSSGQGFMELINFRTSRKSLHPSNLSSSLTYFPLFHCWGENYIKPHFCHILPLISLVGGKATEYRWL